MQQSYILQVVYVINKLDFVPIFVWDIGSIALLARRCFIGYKISSEVGGAAGPYHVKHYMRCLATHKISFTPFPC